MNDFLHSLVPIAIDRLRAVSNEDLPREAPKVAADLSRESGVVSEDSDVENFARITLEKVREHRAKTLLWEGWIDCSIVAGAALQLFMAFYSSSSGTYLSLVWFANCLILLVGVLRRRLLKQRARWAMILVLVLLAGVLGFVFRLPPPTN